MSSSLSTLETLRLVAPEFADVADDTVNSVLQLAACVMDVLAFDADVRAYAVALRGAHMLKLRKDSSAAASSQIASNAGTVREGDLSISIDRGARDGTGVDDLSSTIYGRAYLALRHGQILPLGGFSADSRAPGVSGEEASS